ncbi:hypothetical protein CRYUN_Cryun23aG0001400 [Craigia yunnanensis]
MQNPYVSQLSLLTTSMRPGPHLRCSHLVHMAELWHAFGLILLTKRCSMLGAIYEEAKERHQWKLKGGS